LQTSVVISIILSNNSLLKKLLEQKFERILGAPLVKESEFLSTVNNSSSKPRVGLSDPLNFI